MSKIRKTIIAAIGLLSSIGASAQVQINSMEIVHSEGMARISFNAQLDAKATPRDYKLIITPVIYNGNDSVELPPIVVETRRTKILDARKGILPEQEAFMAGNGEALRYVTMAEYGPWMQGSSMRLRLRSAGCCSDEELEPLVVSRNIIVRGAGGTANTPAPVPVPAPERLSVQVGGMVMILNRNTPPPAKAPMNTLLNMLEINFRQGSSRLDYYGFDNFRQLNEVVEVLRSSRDNVMQGRIEITGYASPEGTQSGNYTLAMNRALAVRNYILDNVRWLRPANFDIVNGGENWDGLYKLVEGSSMPGRWQVLDIIENTPPGIDYIYNTSRKKMLMELNGGQTWRYMYKVFFPRLRNAAFISVYTPFGAGTASAITEDVNGEIINRAIDLIGRRDFAGAFELLRGVENDPRAWNPIGVCYALDNNTDLAVRYLRRSAEAGYTEAESNLQQIYR